jgi:hypothetical protein
MKILVACEFSGTVRDAFIRAGHDAMSCDLLPTEAPGPHHQGDVFDVIDDGWDLMVAHPPCTFLTNSGVRWLHTEPDRWQDLIDGAVFFRRLLEAPIPRVAVENPIMHKYAAAIIGRRQTQIVQPWMFGHTEQKATGLWLRGLPPLIATEDVKAVMLALPYGERAKVHHASPGPDRWKLRSVTYAGIAAAMATQWGTTLEAVA